MKIIDFEINTGKNNMQKDSDLLDFAIKSNCKDPIFRLYGWSPACLSLGRNQNDGFINKEILNKHNIDVVRRLTGGRALLHQNEITYCYICPTTFLKSGDSVAASYKEISNFLITAFKDFDINLDFVENKKTKTKFNYCMSLSTSADLCYNGKKFIGSAQFRKEGYILQHGSINFDYDEDIINDIFNEDFNIENIMSIKDINPEIKQTEVIKALTRAFEQSL